MQFSETSQAETETKTRLSMQKQKKKNNPAITDMKTVCL